MLVLYHDYAAIYIKNIKFLSFIICLALIKRGRCVLDMGIPAGKKEFNSPFVTHYNHVGHSFL